MTISRETETLLKDILILGFIIWTWQTVPKNSPVRKKLIISIVGMGLLFVWDFVDFALGNK
jgi:hypothetical protein